MSGIRSVCVVGAGAIGSLFAGHLASVVETKLLVRRKEHAEALNRQGLKVTGKSQLHSRVTAATDPAQLEPVDLIIVATKASAVAAAAKHLSGHFPGTTVMTVQNGLGCEDVIAQHGAWPAISSITFMARMSPSGLRVNL